MPVEDCAELAALAVVVVCTIVGGSSRASVARKSSASPKE